MERVRREAGLSADASSEQILGALLRSGCATAVVDAAIAVSESARQQAVGLGLPLFDAWLERAMTALRELATMLVLMPRLPSANGSRDTSTRCSRAREQAEEYLLSDPELRESWDVYRTGFLGKPTRLGIRSRWASSSRTWLRRAST